jgi:hypothetical protein
MIMKEIWKSMNVSDEYEKNLPTFFKRSCGPWSAWSGGLLV